MNPYLQPSVLCNFDVAPVIKNTALDLTSGINEDRQKVAVLAAFIKEVKYAYDEWYVSASETLARKSGMCSSKTNLMIAMLRSIGIPAGYRLLRISSEAELFQWLLEQDSRIVWSHYLNQQNHVLTDVLFDKVMSLDLSKDTPYEKGLQKLGIPVAIKLDDEKPRLVASFDQWAYEKYLNRLNRKNQTVDLTLANRLLDKIREIGASRLVNLI